MMNGLDQLADLAAENLMGAHGPPFSGEKEIKKIIVNYRDTLQFLWDQTVRCANKGLTLNEAISKIKLPSHFQEHYTTQQLYGVVEHHVRQIYSGLFGWFDEDEANLFPVPSPERSVRLIKGFGGIEKVRAIIDSSLEEEDFRWSIELSSWLVRSNLNSQGIADSGEPEDRKRLAAALRGVAYSTSAANIRNWCITRALELDESLNLSRFRKHRFNKRELARRTPTDSLKLLRVLLIPENADAYEQTLQFNFSDNENIFYSIRNSIAVIDKNSKSSLSLSLSSDTWYDLLSMKKTLSEAEEEALVETNNSDEIRKFFSCFDLESLNS
jgi:alkyl sulfatase BDS1-like metallo-beta-lactamase superfamily hydrolase